jgi:hypothetical protein
VYVAALTSPHSSAWGSTGHAERCVKLLADREQQINASWCLCCKHKTQAVTSSLS